MPATGTVNVQIFNGVLTSGTTQTGTAGVDIISSSAGNDVLTGNGGNDLFVFGANSGNDTITDFSNTGGAADKIDLTGYHLQLSDITNILSNAVETNGNTVLQLDTNDSITLLGVHKADIHSSDFHF